MQLEIESWLSENWRINSFGYEHSEYVFTVLEHSAEAIQQLLMPGRTQSEGGPQQIHGWIHWDLIGSYESHNVYS